MTIDRLQEAGLAYARAQGEVGTANAALEAASAAYDDAIEEANRRLQEFRWVELEVMTGLQRGDRVKIDHPNWSKETLTITKVARFPQMRDGALMIGFSEFDILWATPNEVEKV